MNEVQKHHGVNEFDSVYSGDDAGEIVTITMTRRQWWHLDDWRAEHPDRYPKRAAERDAAWKAINNAWSEPEQGFKMIAGQIEAEVMRLEPKLGDLLLLRCLQPLDNEIAGDWLARVTELLPDGCKMIVLNPGQDLTVLSDADLERAGLRRV